MITKTQTLTILATSLLLSGCAGDPVSVSKITTDKKAFLNKEFTTNSISESILKKIPLEQNSRVFSDTQMVFETKTTDIESKTTIKKEVHTYSGLGNGLFQHQIEYSSNNITNELDFSIDYKGLQDIKWISANTLKTNSSAFFEITDTQRWDALGNKVGDLSIIDFRWNVAMAMGMVPSTEAQFKCKVTKVSEAKELHPKLRGQVRYLDCDKANKGSVYLKTKNAYLVDFGFAIPIEWNSVSYKHEYKLLDVINP